MFKIQKYFNKAGGIKLIRQWVRDGILERMILLFLLLGRDKKALEQLRNTAGLMIQRKLCKRMRKELDQLKQLDYPSEHRMNKTVWIFWWQGIDQAPALVKRCYISVQKQLKNWNLILLTKGNFRDYTDIPKYILDKVDSGEITLTHFSDILRVDLLVRNGGLWLDATVLCTSADIPKVIMNADLFVYQTQKPGVDGHATALSSWCMYAKTNSKLLIASRYLLYAYWKKYNYMMDYFLLHQFFTIVCQLFPEEAKAIPPYTNENPHILLLHFFDKYDEDLWEDWLHQSCFHKLSNKLEKEEMAKKGTFYDYVINQKI